MIRRATFRNLSTSSSESANDVRQLLEIRAFRRIFQCIKLDLNQIELDIAHAPGPVTIGLSPHLPFWISSVHRWKFSLSSMMVSYCIGNGY